MNSSNDLSRRFVLSADSAYLSNLAALWAAEPKLARCIEALPPNESYRIEPSKSGDPTLVVPADLGRAIYLHSRYQPREEAARLIQPLNTVEHVAFHVHGFGLGYHVEQLFDSAGDDSVICVVEPDLCVLHAAFEARDLSKLISSGRIIWCWQDDKAELFNKLMPWQPSVTMGFSRVIHAPSVQRSPSFYNTAQTWMDEFAAYAQTSVTTLVLNGKRTAENVAHNLALYTATPSLARLKGFYQGAPAIVVSAGPSLRKNKHLLAEVKGRAVIIAVQTALQPLLDMGIEPDFVTSLDYHDISSRFWEKLPTTLRTELVAEPKAAGAIFDLNPGPLSLLGNDFAESLLAEMKLNKTRLPSGATVAHLAFYLAEHLGCDPIVFIGQDLGFSDGLCYTPGTSYEDVWRPELSRFCTVEMKQWEQIVRDRPILRKVPDQQGREMYTEERLFTYLQHFERDFARTSARIIDATEGGALKRGATPMRLADALIEFCGGRAAIAPPPAYAMDWSRVSECAASLERRRHEAQQIEKISRDTLPLLEEIHDHLDDQPRVNRAIGKIDALRSRMAAHGTCYGLIMQLTQRSELEKFKADRRISASHVDGIEKQRLQVQRDVENVRAVIDAAEAFQALMDQTIVRLARHAPRPQREAA